MILSHLSIGLGLAFGFWAFAFFVGSCIIASCGTRTAQPIVESKPTDLLIATGTGIACTIFSLFVLAAVKWLSPPGIACGAASLALAAMLVAVRRVGFVRVRAQMRDALAPAVRPAWLAMLAICVCLATPALLPPTLFDDTMYHLPYALDWAKAGGLIVDQYIRFPLAQYNIELLYAAAFALHFDPYVQFVTWLFFAITATGIVALTSSSLRTLGATARLAEVAGFLVASVFVSCPLVLRFYDVAYVDIPAGGLLLAFAAAVFLARRDFSRYGFAAAAIGGSFIGVKMSLAPLSIVLAVLLVFAGRFAKARPRRIGIAIVILAIFAAPWFLRNAAIAGDPLDPILNLALRHGDPYWTQGDLDLQKRDLFVRAPPLAVPWLIYSEPSFSTDSVSLSFAFLYVPFLISLWLLVRKRARERLPDFTIGVFLVTLASIDERSVTNHYARYALHFYALYLVMLASAAWLFASSFARRRPSTARWFAPAATVAFICALGVPSPGGTNYYSMIASEFASASNAVHEPRAYEWRIPGYATGESIADVVVASKTGANVLAVQFPNLAYFFRRKNLVSIGDWFGPGRVCDLERAIDRDSLAHYLAARNIGATMISRTGYPLSSREATTFFNAMPALGFREVSQPASDVRAFVKSRILVEADRAEPKALSTIDFEARLDAQAHPENRGAFVLPVSRDGTYVNSLTLIAGHTISFTGIAASADSVLSFDVAKATWKGKPAIAWVDVRDETGTTRIFSGRIPVAIGNDPRWQHVSVPIARRTIAVTFGADSIHGGGLGDWISFLRPRISHAHSDQFIDVSVITKSDPGPHFFAAARRSPQKNVSDSNSAP